RGAERCAGDQSSGRGMRHFRVRAAPAFEAARLFAYLKTALGLSKLGNALFRKLWVSSPSSTQASDGLGTLFNARSCMSCHVNDGRGRPPEG
ncbi:di-heme oxidoredictase family protein, partial [Rhizobium johnstonii]